MGSIADGSEELLKSDGKHSERAAALIRKAKGGLELQLANMSPEIQQIIAREAGAKGGTTKGIASEGRGSATEPVQEDKDRAE